MSADLDDWLWKRRGRFLGARHFLSDESVKLLPIERLPLEEFSRDFLQLIAMGRQYLLCVGVGMVEKDFRPPRRYPGPSPRCNRAAFDRPGKEIGAGRS